MLGATKVWLLAGKGVGSSLRAGAGCRKLCLGFNALGVVAQTRLDHSVANTGVEPIGGHAFVGRSGGSFVAQNLFDRMPDQVTAHQTSVVSPHAKRVHGDLASLVYFSNLRKLGVEPDEIMLSAAISVCGLLRRIGMGMSLHCLVIKQGSQDQIFVASNLTAMYSKCATIEIARRVFDQMPVHDAISWNSMVASYLHHGLNKEAIDMFSVVLSRVCDRIAFVNNFTLSGVLRACATMGASTIGRSVHSFVLKLHFEWDVVVMSSLVDMYAKHGYLHRAHLIFEKMEERDVIAWNAMISGYAQHSHGEVAVKLFQQMQLEGFLPNEITFSCVLKASAGLQYLDLGTCLHASVTKYGYLSDSFVGTALIDMYSKCSQMEDAESAFMLMGKKNLVSINALITGYGLVDRYEKALQVYIEVLRKGMIADPFTFIGILSSCPSRALAEGSQIHCHIIKLGFDSDISVGNSLVSFYAKCVLTDFAAKAFESIMKPNSICWSGIISCFVQNDEGEKAMRYFQKMLMLSQNPDEFSFSAVFKALAEWAAGEQGKHLHALVIKVGLESAVFVGSALIDMYCKCGMVEDSLKIFISLPQKNVVSWNAMIVGLAQNGLCKKSLELFQEMVDVGIIPDSVTFIGVLVACGHSGLVDQGKYYFNLMADYKICPTIEHYTCMVDLLGHNGNFHEAEILLNSCSSLPEPATWRSLLASCRTLWNKEVVLKVAKECLILDPHSSGTHVLLSNIWASKGLWSEVTQIRNSMKDVVIRKEPGFSWIGIKNTVYVFTAEQKSGFPEDMMSTLLTVHLEMRI